MSPTKAHKDGSFKELASWLISTSFLALPFLMLALFYFLKRPLSRLLRLEERSLHWPSWRWVLMPMKWMAVVGCAYGALSATLRILENPAFPEPAFLSVLFDVAVTLACAAVFNLIHWMKQHYLTPSTQKKLAGLQAERLVRELIEAQRHDIPGSCALHGSLFVFNKGSAKEFSVEVDHLLITPRNIFVIETKYKSGRIHATATARQWQVTSIQGSLPMQNALQQVKNAAQVLRREFNLPCSPVPLVAIKGNAVEIVDGPSNVVRAEEIMTIIEAFERNGLAPLFDTAAVAAGFAACIDPEKAALDRHIARAEAAKARGEMARIVDAASLQ